MINRIPLTGFLTVDIALAFIIACYGFWTFMKYGSRWGWVVIGAAAFWGYMIFQRI